MNLVLTTYLDAEPETVEAGLETAVASAVDAAAHRIGVPADQPRTERIRDGFRLTSGLDVLDGAEITVDGQPRLVEVAFRVPWGRTAAETTSLAVATFATALTEEVEAAA